MPQYTHCTLSSTLSSSDTSLLSLTHTERMNCDVNSRDEMIIHCTSHRCKLEHGGQGGGVYGSRARTHAHTRQKFTPTQERPNINSNGRNGRGTITSHRGHDLPHLPFHRLTRSIVRETHAVRGNEEFCLPRVTIHADPEPSKFWPVQKT